MRTEGGGHSLRYGAIVSDVDGTLTSDPPGIPEVNVRALRRFEDAGGRVYLATGRTERAALPFAERLGLSTPSILCNGARITDLRAGSVLWARTISPRAAERALDFIAGIDEHVTALVYVGDLVLTRHATDAAAAHAAKDGTPIEPVGDWGELTGAAVSKCLLITTAPRAGDLARQAAGAVRGVNVVRSEPEYVELLPEGVDKGVALRRLMELEGLARDAVIAVGDNPNDRPMLRAAGLGVAIAGGDPDLVAEAACLVPPPDRGSLEAVVAIALDGAIRDKGRIGRTPAQGARDLAARQGP